MMWLLLESHIGRSTAGEVVMVVVRLSFFYTICEGGVVGVMTLGAKKYGAKTMAEKKWQ